MEHAGGQYGVGLVRPAWGHGAINHGFDLVLVPGAFSRDEITALDPTVPVAAGPQLAGTAVVLAGRGLQVQEDALRGQGLRGQGLASTGATGCCADSLRIQRNAAAKMPTTTARATCPAGVP